MMYVGIELKTRCEKCDNAIMLNGPAREVLCSACQHTLDIHPMIWKSILANLPNELADAKAHEGITSNVIAGEFEHELTATRANPVCRSCGKPLTVPKRLDSGQSLVCPHCATENTVEPAPEWLTTVVPEATVLVNATLRDQSATDTETDSTGDVAGRSDSAGGKPIYFTCPACKGGLKVDGSSRLVTCEFCGADIYLPDDLWLRMHPVTTVATWYIGFTGHGRDLKQKRIDSDLLQAAYDAEADDGIDALRRGADPNATDSDGRTAVFLAAATDAPELVRALLDAGAQPDTPDSYGTTPVNIASYNGNEEVVELLLEHDLAIDHRNKLGVTALNAAAKTGYVRIVKKLLAAGADPTIATNDGETPEERAKAAGHAAIVRLLHGHR